VEPITTSSGESINLGAPVRFLVWGPPSITSEPPLLDGNLPSNYRGPRNGFLLICGAPERRSGAFRLTFTTDNKENDIQKSNNIGSVGTLNEISVHDGSMKSGKGSLEPA
jgi:hypothetical protein